MGFMGPVLLSASLCQRFGTLPVKHQIPSLPGVVMPNAVLGHMVIVSLLDSAQDRELPLSRSNLLGGSRAIEGNDSVVRLQLCWGNVQPESDVLFSFLGARQR